MHPWLLGFSCSWQKPQQKNRKKNAAVSLKRGCNKASNKPSALSLRRVLSSVPTPIALGRLDWVWFRFGHTQVWVWAPFVALCFIRGTAPATTYLKKAHAYERKKGQYGQQRGTKSKVDASPLPSRGPKRGRKCKTTPAFSGIPNKGEQNQKWLPHPCLLRGPKEGGNATSPLHFRGSPNKGTKSKVAQKWAEVLRNPYVLGGPQKGVQKWPTLGSWKKSHSGGP